MEILKRQEALSSVLIKFTKNILETAEDSWTMGLVETRREILDEYWNDFQRNHVDLISMQPILEAEAELNLTELHSETQERYVQARANLRDVNRRIKAPTSEHGGSSDHYSIIASGTSRLPRISISKFAGKREDWEPFRDLFKAMIHNALNLTDVKRLYYLISYVKGEEKTALHGLKIVGSKYTTAWNLLEARYEHRRLLVQDHLMALRKLKPLREENAAGLQGLLHTLERHREQLQTLERPVQH